MFTNPFYRAGNALVSAAGIVIQSSIGADADGNFNHFSVNIPGAPAIMIRKREYPEEYEQYLTLYKSAPLLISLLLTPPPKLEQGGGLPPQA
jgi:hypothetical protein